MNNNINFAYNSPLVYKEGIPVAYEPPLWGIIEPEYLCWDYSIYRKSKLEVEEEYNIKFPLHLEKDQNEYDELINKLHDVLVNYPYCGKLFIYDSYS